MTVSGTVEKVAPEPDGDYHVLLRLDAGQTCNGVECINHYNVSDLGGDLLLEPVCMHEVTQENAKAACVGYRNPMSLPAVGSRVEVTGPWVYDLDHSWNEIHPLESYRVLASESPTPNPTATATPTPTANPTPPPPPPSPTPAPAPPPAPAVLQVAITASQYGYLAARTSAGAVCSARARLPSGNWSEAAGLNATPTAGADGMVSWSYRTSSRTKAGTGTHYVSCNYQGQTANASAPFSV